MVGSVPEGERVDIDRAVAAARVPGWTTLVTDHHEEFAPGSTADITVDPRRIDETYAHTGVCGGHVLARLLRVAAPKTIPHPRGGFDADPDAIGIGRSIPVRPLRTGQHHPVCYRGFDGFAIVLKTFARVGRIRDVGDHDEGFFGFGRTHRRGPASGPAGVPLGRPGMYGLPANRMTGFNGHPVVVVNRPAGPDDPVSGSGRAPRWFDITTSPERHDGLSATGHQQACGLRVATAEKPGHLAAVLQETARVVLLAVSTDGPKGDLVLGPDADCDAGPQDLRPLFELVRRTEGRKPFGHGFTPPVVEIETAHHGCLSPVQEETMTTPPTTSRLLGIGWCALVPFAVVALYLGLGTVAVSLIGEPIAATCVLGMLVVILVGSVRVQRPQWLAHAPAPRPRVEVPRFGRTAVGCAVLAFLAGQSMALWIYATTGSTGFDASSQTRQAAGVLTTLLLAMVAAPAGEEALFRGLVYPLLRKRVSILASTLVTAVVFGLLHGNAVQFASTLPLAVLLALIYEHTRVLWPCVLLHLGFNLAAALVPAQVLFPLANPVSAALLYLAFAGCAFGLYRRVAGLTAPGAVKASGSESAMQ